jgi:hypothetical protein
MCNAIVSIECSNYEPYFDTLSQPVAHTEQQKYSQQTPNFSSKKNELSNLQRIASFCLKSGATKDQNDAV